MTRVLAAAIALTILPLSHYGFAGDYRDISGYPHDVRAYDPREVALLPRYCIYTQEFREHVPAAKNRAEMNRWYEIQGPTFHAMHHYCWGLMRTNRALLLTHTKQARDRYLQESIWDFDYVIERAPASFILLPEILTKKGENLIRLGKGPMAIQHLQRAIELKPDYWPPYMALSDYYSTQRDLNMAKEVLENALQHSPDAKPVKKRLAQLNAAGRTSSEKALTGH